MANGFIENPVNGFFRGNAFLLADCEKKIFGALGEFGYVDGGEGNGVAHNTLKYLRKGYSSIKSSLKKVFFCCYYHAFRYYPSKMDPQTAEKSRIKLWLKAGGRSREWLGKKVHVKKRTVNNWLSSAQQIPADKLTLIQRIITDEELAEMQERQKAFPANQVFSLEVDLPTYRAYSEAAKEDRMTLEEWAINELNEAAGLYFEGRLTDGPARVEIAMVAEDGEAGPVEGQTKRVRYPHG